MKENWKRAAAAGSAVALMAGMLSGCNKKETAGSDEVVVTVGSWFVDEETYPDVYANQMKMVEDFEKLHPNVKIEDARWMFDAQSYMAKAEGETLPTLYSVPATECNKIMDLGYAAELTDEMDQRDFTDMMNEFMLDKVSRDGKIYMLPRYCYDQGIAVNVDLYKQAGFVSEDGTLYQPENWEDLARVAGEIKQKTGADGFMLPTTNNCGGWRFTTIAWGYGTEFEKQIDGKWQATFDSPECANALQFVKDLKWKYDVLPKNTLVELDECAKQLAAGNVGMIMAENSVVNNAVSLYGMDVKNIGMLSVPAGDKRKVSLMGGEFFIIDRNANKEQIKAALDWCEYNGITIKLTDERKTTMEENMIKSKETGGIVGLQAISPWKDECEVETYQRELNEKYMSFEPKYIEHYNDKDGIEYQAEEPIDAQELYNMLDSAVQEVLTNQDADPASVLKTVAANFQETNLNYAE